MNIEHKIRNIVGRQLNVGHEQIKKGSLLVEDLGIDSLNVMELALALEEEFEIDISDKDTERLRTFEDVVQYISIKVEAN